MARVSSVTSRARAGSSCHAKNARPVAVWGFWKSRSRKGSHRSTTTRGGPRSESSLATARLGPSGPPREGLGRPDAAVACSAERRVRRVEALSGTKNGRLSKPAAGREIETKRNETKRKGTKAPTSCATVPCSPGQHVGGRHVRFQRPSARGWTECGNGWLRRDCGRRSL